MDFFSPIILLTSPFILVAYVCRLSMLSFKANRPTVILFHMGLTISTGWAAYRAWMGVPQFGDLASIVAAGAWILISYGSWKDGVPEHFSSQPTPLDTEDWLRIHGSGKVKE